MEATNKLTPKEFLKLYQENDEDCPEGFEQVQDGDWVSEGKMDLKEDVFKHIESGRFFQIISSRSGSYFTDYYYEDPECWEVEQVQVTRVEYRAIQ